MATVFVLVQQQLQPNVAWKILLFRPLAARKVLPTKYTLDCLGISWQQSHKFYSKTKQSFQYLGNLSSYLVHKGNIT